MNIRITYCGMWNYLPKAQVVASEIRENYDLEVKYPSGINIVMQKGSNGVFDVQVEEHLIFSKHIKGRFPAKGEITRILLNK